MMRRWRKFDGDRISWPDCSASENDAHDASLPNDTSLAVPTENRLQQARFERIDLCTRISQPSHLDARLVAEMKDSTRRKGKQVDACGRYVLPHLSRRDGKPVGRDLGEKLRMDEMHLAKVRLVRIHGDARAVLDGATEVCVTRHTQARDESDLIGSWFRETVFRISTHGQHDSRWIHKANLVGEVSLEDQLGRAAQRDVLAVLGRPHPHS